MKVEKKCGQLFKSLYVGGGACVRVRKEVGMYFEVKFGLRRLCNVTLIFADKVVKEVNEKMGNSTTMRDEEGTEWEI